MKRKQGVPKGYKHNWNKEKQEYEPVLNTNKYALGGIAYKNKKEENKYEVYQNKEELKKRINEIITKNTRRKKNTYIYAHYGQYDYYGIWKEEIEKHKILKLNPILIKITDKAWLIDTSSFYPYSLAKIGDKIGIPKLEMPRNPKTTQEIETYLKKDLEITLESIYKLKKDLEKIGITPKRMITSGQVAMTAYKTWLRKKPELSWTIMEKGEIIDTKHDEIGRKAYKIGRCEAFQTGKHENCTLIDKNSLFPYAMTQIEMPDLRREYYLINPEKTINKINLINNYTGIIECTLKTPENMEIGMLPVKYGSYLMFPNKGYITGTWTIPEIKKSQEYGYKILKIHKALFYPKAKKNPFTQYITEKYKQRLEYPELSQTIKILMNNIHGKLGQKKKRTEIKIDVRQKYFEYKKEGYTPQGTIDNKYYYEKKEEEYETTYTNVVLASLIVSKAREIMYEEYLKIPREDLLYTDVDSIIFKGNHINKFKIGNQLGEFKIVTENQECNIHKEKLYWIGKEVKASGINKKDLTPEKLDTQTEFVNHEMITLPEAMKLGNYSLLGTFREKKMIITERMKTEIELPEHVIEKYKEE